MYISTKSEILCSFVSRYYDATFVFISLCFFFFFISVGLSQRVGGRGFSPATFIENKRKIEPEELRGYTIPLLLITYTCPATWNVSDSPVNDFFTFSCSFRFPWVFRLCVCVINSQFLPICYPLTWPAKGETWSSVLCWSPLSPLPSVLFIILSPVP